MLHLNVLDENRQKLLPELAFLKSAGFYLAGGTALALQIGHRTSVDFDFYTPKSFQPQNLVEKLSRQNITIIQESEDTLGLRANNVELSFFKYSYKLLEPLQEEDQLNLASLKDIAAMKVIALVQRGLYRDFIDLYFLIKMFGFDKVLEFAEEKYPPFNKYLALQALTYFIDADEDSKSFKASFFKEINWEGVKKFFTDQVKLYKEQELT